MDSVTKPIRNRKYWTKKYVQLCHAAAASMRNHADRDRDEFSLTCLKAANRTYEKAVALPADIDYRPHALTAIVGTSLQGYIQADYRELVRVLGEPERNIDEPKIQAEWRGTIDGVTFTLYDWKQYGTPVEAVTSWNIGGFNPEAVNKLCEYLALNAVPVKPEYWLGRVI